MKNIKLFTHTDLDGVGCAVIAKIAFENCNLDIEYCNYDDINKRVNLFLQENNPLEWQIYITDISVDEETAEKLNKYPNNMGMEGK